MKTRILGDEIDGEGREREDLCIRFVNTVAWRLRNPAEERLGSPKALLDWFEKNDLGSAGYLAGVGRAWMKRPADAAAVYRTAIRLREAIYDVMFARVHGQDPARNALTFLSGFLAQASPGVRLKSGSTGLGWEASAAGASPIDLLTPVALSAADLMTGPRATKVRQCQDDRGCGWLFVDESRTRNRRWCSMGDCGNRAKAHRHYNRAKRAG
jgi:predicted RNA-binding Zn ribbon-like protein